MDFDAPFGFGIFHVLYLGFSVLVLTVALGIVVLLVRFLLIATKAAQLYIRSHDSNQRAPHAPPRQPEPAPVPPPNAGPPAPTAPTAVLPTESADSAPTAEFSSAPTPVTPPPSPRSGAAASPPKRSTRKKPE